jgi:ubiquitin-activating enzyme E1
VRRIAGSIIPAIVTTTAMICGFVALEVVKVLSGCRERSRIRNGCVNLAAPLFALWEGWRARC